MKREKSGDKHRQTQTHDTNPGVNYKMPVFKIVFVYKRNHIILILNFHEPPSSVSWSDLLKLGRHPANSCEKLRILLNLLTFTWIYKNSLFEKKRLTDRWMDHRMDKAYKLISKADMGFQDLDIISVQLRWLSSPEPWLSWMRMVADCRKNLICIL